MVLRIGVEVVPMIFVALAVGAVAVVAFAVVVAGVQASDRRGLGEWPGRGWADGFARRVLGVYVRRPAGHGQDMPSPCERERR